MGITTARAEPITTSRFRVVSRLGEGAHGVVYEAIDARDGRTVAMKVLRHWQPRALARFKREFRSLVDVVHPNVVRLGELFEHNGEWFFTMDLVEGIDPRDFVQGGAATATRDLDALRGRLDAPAIARLRSVLRQVGAGLAAVHAAGVVHRDVKPTNMRVTRDGRVVLLDFGVVGASRTDSMADDRVVGTAAYMAPEQARGGETPGPAADSYAVGVFLYELLTGRLPFTGGPVDIMLAKQRAEAAPPSSLVPDVPADLDALCSELLSLDPERRPRASDLERRAGDASAVETRAGGEGGEEGASVGGRALVGRVAELGLLDDALARAAAGRFAFVSVTGEAGVGKTALLDAFAERVAARGAPGTMVLRGRSHERENVPYKLFDAAVDTLGRRLARLPPEECARFLSPNAYALTFLFPVLGQVHGLSRPTGAASVTESISLGRQAREALRALLREVGARGPVVLLLDDVDRADPKSLKLLEAIARQPDAPPILLVAASAPLEQCSLAVRRRLEMARTVDGGQPIELGPLDADDAARLAAGSLGARSSEETTRAVARESGGHPLFVEHLARFVAGGGPPALSAIFEDAAARLSTEGRRLLEVAALAGVPLPPGTLARAAGVHEDALGALLVELRSAGLARVRARAHDATDAMTPVAIAHPSFAKFLVASIEGPSRQRAHAALSTALGDIDRAKMAETLLASGRPDEAASLYLAAAASAPPRESLDLRRRAAELLLRSGRLAEGMVLAADLARSVGVRWSPSPGQALGSALLERTRLRLRGLDFVERAASEASEADLATCDVLWSLASSLSVSDVLRAAAMHTRGLRLALDLGEPRRLARALAFEGMHGASGDSRGMLRTRGVLSQAESLARKLEDPYLVAFAHLAAAYLHVALAEGAETIHRAETAAALFQAHCPQAWELGTAQTLAIAARATLGQFGDLENRYDAAYANARARGDRCGLTMLVTACRLFVDLAADRPDACQAEVERTMADWPASAQLPAACATLTLVALDLYRGGAAAHDRIEAAWPRLEASMTLRNQRLRIQLVSQRGLAALAALESRPQGAPALLRLAQRCAATLRGEGLVDSRATAHMLGGQVAHFQGDDEGAARNYKLAAELYSSLDLCGRRVASQRLAELVGGAEAREVTADNDAWARAERVVAPERLFAMLCPVRAPGRRR